ncbi:MAG: hypothetical protein COX19_06630 [Desulfobacterales bacterium CG23_combo_of_CG06-09_8_20_14_all_51_8]|nr:MAG: hypothetical protein COX19_06630 [Desulfobacterales bacterium CG23_combo_of_CG06-09_8_20_14_all_51_8]
MANLPNPPNPQVNEICSEMANLPESNKPAANHLTDFDPPIYNVRKQQTKSEGSKHFGNSETLPISLDQIPAIPLMPVELAHNLLLNFQYALRQPSGKNTAEP